MKLKSVIAGVATALATVSAFATDYTWKSDVKSGNWCDKANWKTGDDDSTDYPNSTSAIVHVPKGGGYVIDLGGKTIQLSTTANSLRFDKADGDGPLTLRNGQIKTGKAYPAGDVVLDAVSFPSAYCQPAEKSHVVFTGTSPAANSELAIGASGEKSILCDIFGDTTCGRGQLKGGTAEGCDYPTTLTVSNATLTFNATLANIENCKLRFLDGGKITAAKFRMSGAATAELALKDADMETPRVSSSGETTLKSMAFVVTSAETAGKYPLVKATGSSSITGYGDCTLDVSALGAGWTGELEYSDKTLWAVLDYSTAVDNEWETEPSITKSFWNPGEAAGVIDFGKAKYGDVTCNYTQEQVDAWGVGRYTLTFTVEETEAYTGLTKTLDVVVLGEDTQAAVYTWRTDVKSGSWCDPANWTSDVGTRGYPSNTLVKAHLPKSGGYVIDLEGCTIPLSTADKSLLFDVELPADAEGAVTLRNGVIETGVTYPAGDVVLDGMAFTQKSLWLSANSHAMLQGTSPAENLELVVKEPGASCEVFGDTRCGRGQLGVANGDTTLTVSNATLSYSVTLNIYASPVIRLMRGGRIACESTKANTGKFQPNAGSKPRIELALTAEDQSAPRITASYTASLQGGTAFVITSLDASGRYPLVCAQGGVTGTDGCTLDVSALGEGWRGSLVYSDSDKTLWAEINDPSVAENEWEREPSISATSWNAGEAAGVIDFGKAKYGDVTCNYTQENINGLGSGRYELTFAVEGTAQYTGLLKTIDIVVKGPESQPATYTWKSGVASGDWCDPENWTTEDGTLGYPSNTHVKAVIPAGGPYVIDLAGCTIPLAEGSGLSIRSAGALTLRGGAIQTGTVDSPGGQTLTLDGVSFETSSLNQYLNLNGFCELVNSASLLDSRSSSSPGASLNASTAPCCIRDGYSTVGSVILGPVLGIATTTELAVSNATLAVENMFQIRNTAGSTLPLIKLQNGRIDCKGKNGRSGQFIMGCPARTELSLTAADKSVPRIQAASSVTLTNMAFAIVSAETRGRYPLVRCEKNDITFKGTNEFGGCTLDVSALGTRWSGSLEYRDQTLWARIKDGAGLMILLK